MKLKIATYNVKHCEEGIDAVAGVLRKLGADIVGIQEVDRRNERSPADQPALLSKAAGYPHYRFTPAIDYRGGEYGTLILSRLPIVEHTVVRLYSAQKEGRAVGHAVVRTEAGNLDFFNTHLSYESTELRYIQFGELGELMNDCPNAILTGDFNTENFSEFWPLGDRRMVNRPDSRRVTFPKHKIAIDNILVPAGCKELAAGTVTDSHSDHYLLWAEVQI